MTLWKELIEIPKQVHKSDFVLNLSEGVNKHEQTVRSYVVTDGLAEAFKQALGLIQAGLETGSSRAAYLHGSFGSGKSHFMAILDLLLEDAENATGVRDLKRMGPVLEKHGWLGQRKLLMVPYHFIGAPSMEAAILGGYVDFVRRRHPEASLPGVYVADAILTNADVLRAKMGDEAFFGVLNQGAGGGRWGALGATWDAARYEKAAQAAPGAEVRAELVGDLVARLLTSVQETTKADGKGFVSLDEGLAILSRHTKGLGYDGLILFLDELILWLASRAADLEFIHREGQKLSKLVEAQQSDRPVPIISFVARQRDLREFIGDAHTGAERSAFSDSLQWWEGRFDMITLEDRNLPVIAGERLLKPVGAKAAEQIAQSFERTLKRLQQSERDVIRTREATDAVFQQVYPFSPVLVQALVALATFLQRERTSLRLMLMLLVRQRDALKLGDIVPVGDLWDVVASGEEPFSEAMRKPFRAARDLWEMKLRPMLEEQHAIPEDRSQVSGAKLQAYRNDARLLKTLLLAALVPQVEAFKELTQSRLLALNYGTVRAPVPGMERSALAGKLQTWASKVGEIRVAQKERDPRVSMQLSTLDPELLIERVNHEDNPGNRRRVVKQMLFDWLGLKDGDLLAQETLVWRGEKRMFQVRYRNVRELTLDGLENGDAEWTIIIDYPFDEKGHGPSDDKARLTSYLDERPKGTHTVGWLPVFLSQRGQEQLGRLVKLNYLLKRFDEHATLIPEQDRPTMRQLLENNRNALHNEQHRAMMVAYGLSNEHLDTVDRTLEDRIDHLVSLWPGFTPRLTGGQDFKETLRAVVRDGLEARYPDAPKLPDETLTRGQLTKIAEVLQRSIASTSRRAQVDDKVLRSVLREYATPVGLGEMGETHFSHSTAWREQIERTLGRQETLTVKAVRDVIDPPKQPTGMPRAFQDLIIASHAWLEHMAITRRGEQVDFSYGKLPDDAKLVRRALPSAQEWELAVKTATEIMKLEFKAQMRNAQNVETLANLVATQVKEKRRPLKRLLRRLDELGAAMGMSNAERRDSERYQDALQLEAMLEAFETGASATAQVKALTVKYNQNTEANLKTLWLNLKDHAKRLEKMDTEILEAGHSRSGEELIGELMVELRKKLKARQLSTNLSLVEDQYKRLLKVIVAPTPQPSSFKLVVDTKEANSEEALKRTLEALRKAWRDAEGEVKLKVWIEKGDA